MAKVVITVGLAIGEETKGATVEWLTELLGAHTVLRHGGCQAGHHVVTRDGRDQMFSHFGCGTFAGANTHLQHMVINPVALFNEALELEEKGILNPLSKITVHRDCLVITPFHGGISRLREIYRGKDKKGTIGMGVGDALKDASKDEQLTLRAGDFFNVEILQEKVARIFKRKQTQARELIQNSPLWHYPDGAEKEVLLLEDESLIDLTVQACRYLAELVRIVDDGFFDELANSRGVVVGESSHGALLHPRYGFVPHTTQVDPTGKDLLQELKTTEVQIVRLGVLRSYMTRHGAGPLVTACKELFPETHNTAGSEWLGAFRNGHFDLVALRYAIALSGGPESFDGLVVSFMDTLQGKFSWPVCIAYQYKGSASAETINKFFELEKGQISGIGLRPDNGSEEYLADQAFLTSLLKDCVPVLTNVSPEGGFDLAESFLRFIEENTHVPVVATAHGPKASDRKIRAGHESFFSQL